MGLVVRDAALRTAPHNEGPMYARPLCRYLNRPAYGIEAVSPPSTAIA
jgi:hypothetical protein